MRVLVTGPESSGTKLAAQILARAGGEVTHYTPRSLRGDRFITASEYDVVVIVVRDTYSCSRSSVQNGHAANVAEAQWLIADSLYNILKTLKSFYNVYFITYSSITNKVGSMRTLCRTLGLDEDFEMPQVGDSDAKYYGGDYFRDSTPLHERGEFSEGPYKHYPEESGRLWDEHLER